MRILAVFVIVLLHHDVSALDYCNNTDNTEIVIDENGSQQIIPPYTCAAIDDQQANTIVKQNSLQKINPPYSNNQTKTYSELNQPIVNTTYQNNTYNQESEKANVTSTDSDLEQNSSQVINVFKLLTLSLTIIILIFFIKKTYNS